MQKANRYITIKVIIWLKVGSIFDILRGKSEIYGGIQMAFQLNSVVPWGRNFAEYRLMFELSDKDMKKKIAGYRKEIWRDDRNLTEEICAKI